MSFRARLTLFFVLIVVVPMVALAAIVVQVAGSAQTGKADARLSAALDTALGVYGDARERAEGAARRAATDPALAAGIRAGRPSQVRAAAERIVRQGAPIALEVLGRDDRRLASVGSDEAVAEAELMLRRAGRTEGTLIASTTSAVEFARRVGELTDRNATVSRASGTIATTVPVGDTALLPAAGSAETVELRGEELRAASAALGGADDELRLTVFAPIEPGGFIATRPLVAAALAGFFLVALAFVLVLLRSLQGQIQTMLSAARRIGGGDFSQKLPVEGDDEIAALAREFNSMSDRLSTQMGELQRQRVELEQSVRRIGEAFASGLDRSALLEIVAETAASACEADHARILLSGSQEPEAAVGEPLGAEALEAARAAEREALRSGRMAEAREGDAFAISHPLAAASGGGEPGNGSGREGRPTALAGAVMTIARHGRPFDRGQREVLRYLIGQAAASIENVELHELVAEQAVTDELTGLPNNRRFRRWIATEIARAERFDHDLSLLMLDIDDFKRVNDTYGHLQGDEVLRTIGRILREESRGIDEPARYGGEEFAIGLPETGIDGALEVAERVRGRIARTPIPLVDGDGSIEVTASLGAATVATAGADARALIDAADQALYAAKRGGKNRTERANGAGGESEGKRPRTAKIRGDG